MNNDVHSPSEIRVKRDQTRWPTQMTRPGGPAREAKHDFVKHVVDYSREHPGVAAFCCVSIGFILGWKLKPW